ncbi:MAG: Por secretion system protein, partial [Bacteroidetes bacterium]
EDGKETLEHFTERNSPLPSNTVRSLAVDENTGEVFIGTEGGLVSYQGDAVRGTRVHTNRVQVFPNPVRPDYDGPIAIRGLSENAKVKITDVNGKLVNEIEALGGQAIWNGRDYNGRRVQTGVYLVFASTNPREAGLLAQPDGVVTKIVFVN